jgi:hypothetical protein
MSEGRCPTCDRIDAKAGAVWGCRSCRARFDSGSRWWDVPHPRRCPHCTANGLLASLEFVETKRGVVERCWQCGGEYVGDDLVWPKKAS